MTSFPDSNMFYLHSLNRRNACLIENMLCSLVLRSIQAIGGTFLEGCLIVKAQRRILLGFPFSFLSQVIGDSKKPVASKNSISYGATR